VNALRLVFAGKEYVALAIAVFIGLWVLMASFDQLLFFEPLVAFHVPPGSEPFLALSTITAALLGIVVSMNVYVFRTSKVRLDASFFSGSTLGVAASACAGCTSAGFFMATTFGVAGAATASVFAEYQVPLRILSVGLLGWALYSVSRRVTQSCAIKPGDLERR
jgi:hypothetical protein